jgi:flavin-dependent dehydrogenase
MENIDVVIIGAGLAGLQCANLLADTGARVLLVDKKASLSDAVHTTGIFVRRTLEDFELPEDCLGPAIRDVTLYSPARRSMDLVSPHAEFRVGKMAKLYNRMLEQCQHAGVEWLPETRFLGLLIEKERVVVRLSNSQPFNVTARLVIGADGANSRVARALGLDVNQEWIVGVEDVVQNVPLVGPPRLHCFLDPEVAPGYLAWIANDGEEAHVGVGGYASSFEPLVAIEKFRASLKTMIDLSKSRIVERRAGRIPVGGVLKRIGNRHGLLVGDAAGAVSPLTAGGLDPCMRLSTYAALLVAEFLESGDARVLDQYSGELFRARFTSRLWMRRIAATIRHPLLLELGCASLRMPPLNWIAWQIFFGRGSFPNVTSEADVGPLAATGSNI